MSVSTMVETYDMPMTDYNEDGDIPMGGSSENWFQPLPHMDEDAHHYDVPSESLEVDMMFEETTTEYEMADEAAQLHDASVDTNVIDAELYDATVHTTPLPPVQTDIVEGDIAQPQVSGTHELATEQPHKKGDRPPLLSGEAHYFHTSDEPRGPDAPQAPLDMRSSEHTPTDPSFESHSEHHDTDTKRAGQSANLAGEATDTGETRSSAPPLDAHPAFLQPDVSEGRSSSEIDDKPPNPSVEAILNEAHVNHETTGSEQAEGDEARETGETGGDAEDTATEQPEPHASLPICVQAPPIFLSLQVTSTEGDQPDFVLFNLPGTGSHEAEEPLLLLQHHPQLFYEPVSAVFDAFRREEYFSHLEELSEAEMALNAHELQLVISEDNIYAREVSLQDLYAMHQGVGLSGYLRLTLQSIVPRFIARYNHLRDQITRAVLTNEEDAGQHALPTNEEEHSAQTETAESQPQEEQPEISHRIDDVEETAKEIDSTDVADRSEEEERKGHRDPDDHDEGGTDENESNTAEAEENLASDSLDAAGNPLYEETPHEHEDDLSGGNDETADSLDADAIHITDHEHDVDAIADAAATEYADAAEPHEEGDEGYGDDFEGDGAEGTGTTGDTTEPTEFVGEDGSQQNVDELQQSLIVVPNEVQLGAISHSTSASNSEADDSSWEDAEKESASTEYEGHETNESAQQTKATVFDEEGNYADEYEGDEEFGEEYFGEDDFDDSAEATLEDPTENRELSAGEEAVENAQRDDEASRAALEESEKFLASLENEEDIEATKLEASSDDNARSEGTEQSAPAEVLSEKPNVLHKNASKRSLDDVELDGDGETIVTLSSSPDSKRTRTL